MRPAIPSGRERMLRYRSPEWTARSPAPGSAAASPRWRVFAFDAARVASCGSTRSTTPGRGAGVLCAAHADRLSPPRGWTLLDRRAAESRLWLGRAGPTTPATAAASRTGAPRPHRARPASPVDSPEPAPEPAVPAAVRTTATRAPVVATIVTVPDADRTAWSPHDRPGADFERVLDARTPLLARAFEAVRHDRDD